MNSGPTSVAKPTEFGFGLHFVEEQNKLLHTIWEVGTKKILKNSTRRFHFNMLDAHREVIYGILMINYHGDIKAV